MTTMAVQEPGTCSNFFQTMSDSVSDAANWCGRTLRSMGSTISEYAQAAAEWAKPYFENLGEMISEHRIPIIVATVFTVIGVAAGAIFTNLFCEKTPEPPVVVTTTQTPAQPLTPNQTTTTTITPNQTTTSVQL